MGLMDDIKRLKAQAEAAKQNQERMVGVRDDLYTQANQPNKGDFYEMLGALLTERLQGGMSGLENVKQSSEGAINKGFNTSRTKMKEDLASRGMGGSGAALSAIAQLGGERASALGDNDIKINQMNEDYKQNALTQLLGLNSFGAGAEQQQFGNLFSLLGLDINQMNFNREMKYKEDNTPSGFGQFLGQLLGAGTQISSAALSK